MVARTIGMAAKCTNWLLLSVIVIAGALCADGCRRIKAPPSLQASKPQKQQTTKPTTTSAPASRPAPFEYEIKRGDTLAKIAEKFSKNKANASVIMGLNPDLDERKLHAGQKILLPGKWRSKLPPEQQ